MKVLIPLALAALALSAGMALAQTRCDERSQVLDHLAGKYKESPIASGVANGGELVEVLADAKGLTWTIIVTTPDGLACMVAAGEGWRIIEVEPGDPEA